MGACIFPDVSLSNDPYDLDRFVRAQAADHDQALEVLGSPDDMKLRSCATLFARVSDDVVFEQLLQKYFNGEPDEETLRRLGVTTEAR